MNRKQSHEWKRAVADGDTAKLRELEAADIQLDLKTELRATQSVVAELVAAIRAATIHLCDYGRIELGTPQSKALIDVLGRRARLDDIRKAV